MADNISFIRNVVGNYMTELGKLDKDVVIINADLSGTSRNKDFVAQFPQRSFNVGIAEQNMVSFAAGLAHEGFIPYAFTMAPFLTMRACEQCRTDVAYANLKVRLVGTYSGVSGGISGATHWAIEDCAIMTGIPNMVVIEPSDAKQACILFEKTKNYSGPIYYRLTCESTENIYSENLNFSIGGSHEIISGDDGAILSSGVTVQFAIKAAKRLKEMYNVNFRVIDMYSLKPIDREAVKRAALTGKVIVAHDHNVVGGLGALAAQVIAESRIATKFRVLGINDEFVAMAHAPYLYKKFGFDVKGIYEAALSMMKEDA